MARLRKALDFPAIRAAIGGRIRSAREAAGISQTILALQVGYQAANPISKIEQGQMAALDIGRLAAIARALDVEFSWIIEPAAKATRGRAKAA